MAANDLVVVAETVVPACAAALTDPLVTGRCADILGWVPVADSLEAIAAARDAADDADQQRLDAAADAIRAAVPSSAQ